MRRTIVVLDSFASMIRRELDASLLRVRRWETEIDALVKNGVDEDEAYRAIQARIKKNEKPGRVGRRKRREH